MSGGVVEFRRELRKYTRRKMTLEVDLNAVPAADTVAAVEPSAIDAANTLHQMREQGGPSGAGPNGTIDVEEIDDEVVISSPRSFAEAKRRKIGTNRDVRRGTNVGSQAHPEEEITRLCLNSYNMWGRVLPNSRSVRVPARQTIIDCEHYITVEDSKNEKDKSVKNPSELPQSLPPPREEPTFSCPVCMGPLVEEMSTKCGHIFCKGCIKAAIKAQGKCPTCRRKVTVKDTIRVYLPTTN